MKIKSRLSDSETEAVKNYIQRFIDTWNKKDLSLFGQFFTASSEFTDVVGQTALGRDAIVKQHEFPFNVVMKEAVFSMDDIYIREILQGIIVISATWTVVGSMTPDQKPLPDRHGVLQMILERTMEDYSIILVHNTDTSLPYERQEKFIKS